MTDVLSLSGPPSEHVRLNSTPSTFHRMPDGITENDDDPDIDLDLDADGECPDHNSLASL